MTTGEDKSSETSLDAQTRPRETQHLRLYIAGNTLRSSFAIQQLKSVCERYLSGRYSLEIVDIYQNGKATRNDNIVAVPTLIKLDSQLSRRLIGDLSDVNKLKLFLEIPISVESFL